MDVQVLLDGRDADPQEAATAAGTLLRAVKQVELVHTAEATRIMLQDRYAASVRPAGELRRDVPVLVTSPRVIFAAGALRRIVKRAHGQGRVVTRVFIPGLSEGQQVTCWSPAWLSSYEGGAADLLDAGLDFDRENLPPGSPTARLWVRGDELGVSLSADVEGKVAVWVARTGAELEARRFWGESVRGRAGVAKRHLARCRQRRAQFPSV